MFGAWDTFARVKGGVLFGARGERMGIGILHTYVSWCFPPLSAEIKLPLLAATPIQERIININIIPLTAKCDVV